MVLVGHILSLTIWTNSSTGLGDLGVIVFFVLSGFLISYTSLAKKNRGQVGFGSYFFDRFARIFTPFVPVLILVASLDWIVLHFTDKTDYSVYFTLKNFVANLLMLQQHPFGLVADQLGHSQLKLATFGSARPFWTVANEWWLYIAFGMLLFTNVWRHAVPAIFVFGCVAIVPLFNMVAGTGQGLSLIWAIMAVSAIYYHRYQAQISSFLGERISTIWQKLTAALVVCILLLLLIVRFFWVSFIEAGFQFVRPIFYDFNFYVLMVLLLVSIFLLLQNSAAQRRNVISQFFADYSYSLYLVHYSLIYCVASLGWLPDSGPVKFMLLFVLCNLVAVVMWWLFERNHRVVNATLNRYFLTSGAAKK